MTIVLSRGRRHHGNTLHGLLAVHEQVLDWQEANQEQNIRCVVFWYNEIAEAALSVVAVGCPHELGGI